MPAAGARSPGFKGGRRRTWGHLGRRLAPTAKADRAHRGHRPHRGFPAPGAGLRRGPARRDAGLGGALERGLRGAPCTLGRCPGKPGFMRTHKTLLAALTIGALLLGGAAPASATPSPPPAPQHDSVTGNALVDVSLPFAGTGITINATPRGSWHRFPAVRSRTLRVSPTVPPGCRAVGTRRSRELGRFRRRAHCQAGRRTSSSTTRRTCRPPRASARTAAGASTGSRTRVSASPTSNADRRRRSAQERAPSIPGSVHPASSRRRAFTGRRERGGPSLDDAHRPGSRRRLSATALRATITLEPDIEIAPTSGRSTNPSGSKTPAAIGVASEL